MTKNPAAVALGKLSAAKRTPAERKALAASGGRASKGKPKRRRPSNPDGVVRKM